MKKETKEKQEFIPRTTFGYIQDVMLIGNDFRKFIEEMGEDYFDEVEKHQIKNHGKTIWPKWYLAYGRFETMVLKGEYPPNQEPINPDNFK
jgi:hypothetical protein